MPKDNRQRNIIIVVVILVLLCICCAVIGGLYTVFGTTILEELWLAASLIV